MAPTDKTVGATPAKMARHHRGRAMWQAAGIRRFTEFLDFRKLAEDRLALTQMLTASIKTMPMPVIRTANAVRSYSSQVQY